jgi:hypothetical protein
VSEVRALGSLILKGCPPDVNLAPLEGLQRLRILSLQGAADDIDLAPLAGLRDLNIWLYEGQRVRGSDRPHPSTTVSWATRSRA